MAKTTTKNPRKYFSLQAEREVGEAFVKSIGKEKKFLCVSRVLADFLSKPEEQRKKILAELE